MDMVFGTFASTSLLIVRVVLGVIFFAHGGQKVFGWFGGPGLRGVIGYFKQALGVPAPLTVLAAFTECFGGLAMIVGLLVRPAAVGLILVMLVAIAKVHWRNGFFVNWCARAGEGARLRDEPGPDWHGAGCSRGRRRSPLDRPWLHPW